MPDPPASPGPAVDYIGRIVQCSKRCVQCSNSAGGWARNSDHAARIPREESCRLVGVGQEIQDASSGAACRRPRIARCPVAPSAVAAPRPEACHVPFLRRRPSGTPTDRIYKKCIMPGLNVESCSEEPGVRSFSRESSAERSGKAPPAPLEGSTDPSALPSIHRGIRPTAQSGIQPEYRSEFSLTKSTPGRRAVRVRCCQFRQAPPLRRPAGPTRP